VRIICGLVGLAAAGFLAATANGLNVPTVSTPTVTAPPVSVPKTTLPTPTLPKPTLPAPTLPKPTVPTSTVPVPTTTVSAPLPKPPAPTPVAVPLPKPPAPKAPTPASTVPGPTLTTPSVATPRTTTPPATAASGSSGEKATMPAPAAANTPAPPSGTIARSTPASRAGNAAAVSPNGGSTAASPAGSYRARPVQTTRPARTRSALPRLRRVIARFTLERPRRVRISIEELAPICREFRSYVIRLPKGTHAFRFPIARVTAIGTYRLTAVVRNHKIFSVRARRTHTRVKLGGSANLCGRLETTRTAFSLSTPGTLAGVGSLTNEKSGNGQLHLKAAHARRDASPHASAGATPEKNPLVRAVSLTDAPRSLQPLLYTLLAIAIALLALAAAPQRVLPAGRAAAIVATRRAYFAAAGIWLLVVVAIVTAFS
jgi:hypothetical protein